MSLAGLILLPLLLMAPPDPGHADGGPPSDTVTPATAADPLREAGVSTADRLAALTRPGTSVAAAAWQAIETCDRCGAANDLAAILAARPAIEIEPLVPRLLEALKDGSRPVLRASAARAMVAMPADRRPAEWRDLRETTLTLQCMRGRAIWAPRELQVLPGTLVRLRMENGDAMVHNLVFGAPGSLDEIGMAAEKLGEGPEAERRRHMPDLPQVLGAMGSVEPGRVGELWFFTPMKPGTYVLVCNLPGQWRTMNGTLTVK